VSRFAPRLGPLLPLIVIAAMLAIPTAASSEILLAGFYNQHNDPQTLYLVGSVDADHVTIRRIENPVGSGKFFYEIEDPDGVARFNSPPTGCFRRDANAIHCPVELVSGFNIQLAGGDDTLVNTTSVPTIARGGPGNEILDGTADDILYGGAGRDKLIGQAGNDMLLGGPGNDKINGGAGNDIVDCGPGKHDVGVGGPGRDLGRRCEIVRH